MTSNSGKRGKLDPMALAQEDASEDEWQLVFRTCTLEVQAQPEKPTKRAMKSGPAESDKSQVVNGHESDFGYSSADLARRTHQANFDAHLRARESYSPRPNRTLAEQMCQHDTDQSSLWPPFHDLTITAAPFKDIQRHKEMTSSIQTLSLLRTRMQIEEYLDTFRDYDPCCMNQNLYSECRRFLRGEIIEPVKIERLAKQAEYCMELVSLDRVRSQARVKVQEYLDSFPGPDHQAGNHFLHTACHVLLSGGVDGLWYINGILKQVNYRMENVMKKATMYKNILGVDFPDCEAVDAFKDPEQPREDTDTTRGACHGSSSDSSGVHFETIRARCFSEAYGLIVVAGLFDRPVEGQGLPYSKGVKYLAHVMASSLWNVESMKEAVHTLQMWHASDKSFEHVEYTESFPFGSEEE